MLTKFKYNNIEFLLEDYGQDVNVKSSFIENNDILKLNLVFDFIQPTTPKNMLLSFCIDRANCLYTWNSNQGMKRNLLPEWKGSKIESRSVIGTPILSFVGFGDDNIATISLSDYETPHTLSGGFSEEHGGIKVRVDLFSGTIGLIDKYSVDIVIDLRSVKFYESVKDASNSYNETIELRNIPEAAKSPLFSTWYSDHQRLSKEKIINDCKKAKELGLDLIIIDDGWQTDDTSYGYGFCGDYNPSYKKVGNMEELVSEIHKLDMKVMLWYSVSFLGEYSANFEKYKDMTLLYVPKGHYYVLDPRFKKVRELISDFLCRSVQKWGIDGLKLDFIDAFRLPEDKVVREGIDCKTLEEGIRLLLTEIKTNLLKINPDFLIEFRQRYIGPAMKMLGTMFRVGDCPGDFIANRIGIADLRFTSGKYAVHGDPIYFPTYASSEYVACALANSIFGVIQFSVTPDNLSDEQYKVVKNYISFAKQYKEVLLDGYFEIVGGSNSCSECRSSLNGLTIVGYYENKHIVDVKSNMIIINGSGTKGVYVHNNSEEILKYTIKDCYGNIYEEGSIDGLKYIDAKPGSMIHF